MLRCNAGRAKLAAIFPYQLIRCGILLMKTLRLLCIDDDKFIRDLIDKTLRKELKGIEIQVAENGKKGQQLLQKFSFDLVLCDWEMPEMTGIELLRWVRQQESLKAQPFVLITSLDQKENVIEASKAGVSEYLSKPFSPKQLLDKVAKQLVRAGVLTREEVLERLYKERISAAGGAELLTGGAGGAPAASRRSVRGKGLLQWQGQRTTALIRSINRSEAALMLKAESFPQLGAEVSLLLAGGTEEQPLRASVPGFVVSLQLAEPRPDCDTAVVRVKLLPQEGDAGVEFARLLSLMA